MSAADAPRDLAWAVAWAKERAGVRGPGPSHADEADALRLLLGAAEDAGTWRRLLWLRHGCGGPALYGDDGEMQCGACGFDFKRMSAAEIDAAWVARSMALLAARAGAGQGEP